MTLCGLDPTAQWLLLGSSVLVLIGSVLSGVFLGGGIRSLRITSLRNERDRLAVRVGELEAHEKLSAALQGKKDEWRQRFWDERFEKVGILGERDELDRKLTDVTAELAEVQGAWRQERAELNKRIAELSQALAAQAGELR